MSFRILRCKEGQCRAAIFWSTTDSGRRIALNDRELRLDEALANPLGVYFLDGGRALKWTPMYLGSADEALYRAHWATCSAPARQEPGPELAPPEVAPEPIRIPAPEPQLRLPVLPRRIDRRSEAAVLQFTHTHERGDHHEHHRHTAAA